MLMMQVPPFSAWKKVPELAQTNPIGRPSSAELTQQNEAQNKPFWVFPKIMGFPPKSSISNRVFPSFSPSILGGFPAILGNPHIFPSVLLRYFVAPKLQEQ